MEKFHTTMPGYRLNDYLVVISPNEDLRKRIINVRKEFNDKFQPAMPLSGKPHLALVHFVSWEMMEEKIVNRFHHIAMGITPFKIELKDFAGFPSHTIYLNVATKTPVQNLVKELRTAQKLMKADPEHDPHFIAEPFIPVARKLLPWQYEKGWLEYSHSHFSAKIVADGMLLLKRPLGDKGYQIVQRFDFMNMPVTTKQGELFF
ncbi:MAG: 2'-5' RNA ligase family protein [Chitinophagaceae bacterium]|nr:MAG: 2'-5' RNA ligase family protein [Chitinophagaceae bacterium]